MRDRKSDAIADPEELFTKADDYEEHGDFKRAFECFLKAARLGHAGCQVNVGNYYAAGKGTKRNMEAAAFWYKKACKNGDRVGPLNLGIEEETKGESGRLRFGLRKGVAMNDGDSCIALAKLYKDRRDKQEAAAVLLKQVLSMSRADISADGKEEAKSLLEEIRMAR